MLTAHINLTPISGINRAIRLFPCIPSGCGHRTFFHYSRWSVQKGLRVYLTLHSFLKIFLPDSNSLHFSLKERHKHQTDACNFCAFFPYTFPRVQNHFTTTRPIPSTTVPVANSVHNAGKRNFHLFTEAPKRKKKQTYKINIIDLFEDAVYTAVLISDEATMSVLSSWRWCVRSLHLLSIWRVTL
jgi:hypothetical protein